MNNVNLIGRLTRDIEVRQGENTSVGRFTVAVNRMKKEDGADFVGCVAFGKTAENMQKYTSKGSLVGVSGRIQTGSYLKEGKTVYTTDVIADRVEFLSAKSSESQNESSAPVSGFHEMDDDSDLPF